MQGETGSVQRSMIALVVMLLIVSAMHSISPSNAADLQVPDAPLPPIVLPENITVGNTADYETFISWTTQDPSTGWIIYGTTPSTLTSTAYDVRGSGAEDTTHLCILNTMPNNDYYYKVVSNGTIYGHNGDGVTLATPGFTWNFSSFAEVSNPGNFPHIVEVCVKYPNGTPANGVLATFYFKRGSVVTTLANALSNEVGTIKWGGRLNGSSRVSLNRIRLDDGSEYVHQMGDEIYFKLNGGHRGIYPATGWDDTHTVSAEDSTFVGNFTLLDTRAPTLYHNPNSSTIAYEPVDITLDAEDLGGVTGATLYYKDGASWSNTPMSLISGDDETGVWKAQITPTVLGGMQYYMNVTDGIHTTRTPRNTADHYLMNILPPPVKQLEMYVHNASATAGITSPMTVNTTDQAGIRTNSSVTITFSSTDPNADLPANYTFAGGDNGQKTFLFTMRTAGNQDITVSVVSDPSINAADSTTVEHGPLDHITVSPPTMSLGAGNYTTFYATGWDSFGNTFNITDDPDLDWTLWGGIGFMYPNGTFKAITIGVGLVNASIDTHIGSAGVSVLSGNPSGIIIKEGSPQTEEVNKTLPTVLSVKVLDSNGNPVENVYVSWEIQQHPGNSTGNLSLNRSLTDASGVAVASFRLGNTTGTYIVNASAANATSTLLGSPIIFNFTATPGEPASMEILAPSNATAGSFTELEVLVYDIFGNKNDTAVVNYTLSSDCADMLQNKLIDRCAGESWINATINTHPAVNYSFSINITPAHVDVIETAFTNHTMEAGSNVSLETTGYDMYDNLNTTWQPIWDTTTGSVVNGTFFAGNSVGSASIVISFEGYPAKAYVNVTITPSSLASIQVHPNPLVIGILSPPRTIGAYGYDVYGNDISIVPTWNFSSPVGYIAGGEFIPLVIGEAVLTASYSGLQGSANIEVADNIPPVVNSSINDSAYDISVSGGIALYFSKEMISLSVLENLTIVDDDAETIGYNAVWDGNNLTVTPVEPLGSGEEYTFILLNAEDKNGNKLGSLIFSFTTEYLEDMDGDGIPDHIDLDKDGDGMNDTWEDLKGFDSSDPTDASEDADGDGLSNLEEFDAGLNPNNEDSDGDGIPDAEDSLPLEPNAAAQSGISILWILLIVLVAIIGFSIFQTLRNKGKEEVYEQGYTSYEDPPASEVVKVEVVEPITTVEVLPSEELQK